MNLDDFNLKLCDYEDYMDAFASFRARQLQASRQSFMDLTSSMESSLELEENSCSGSRSITHPFLEDLHVVSDDSSDLDMVT